MAMLTYGKEHIENILNMKRIYQSILQGFCKNFRYYVKKLYTNQIGDIQ